MKAIALKRAWICTLGIMLLAACLPINVQGGAEEIRDTGLYFPKAGSFTVTGNTENWHTIVGGGWSGTLFLLNVKAIWPGNRSGAMEIEGFRLYPQKNRFQSEITYPEPPEGVELSIRVYGLPKDETPGVLKFRKTVKIKKGAGQYYPLEKGDFTIDGKKPSTMEPLPPFTIEEDGKFHKKKFLYPMIALNFESPSTSSKKSQAGPHTGTSSNDPHATSTPGPQSLHEPHKECQMDIPAVTSLGNPPDSSPTYQSPSPPELEKSKQSEPKMSIDGWGKNLGVEVRDSNRQCKATLIWENPNEPLNFSKKLQKLPELEEYEINLVTPFGGCNCDEKEKYLKDLELSLADCVDKLNVVVKKTIEVDGSRYASIVLSYSKDGGIDWSPFYTTKTDSAGKTNVYIPKMASNSSTEWMLEAKKQGYQSEIIKHGELIEFIKNNTTDIEFELLKERLSIQIKPELPHTMVSVGMYGHVLYAIEADNEGKAEIPFIEGAYIIVEKAGYQKKSILMQSSPDKMNKKITITPINKTHLKNIKVRGKKKYKKMGGDYNSLTLILYDINNKVIFNELMSNMEFIPKDATKYQLKDPGEIYFSKDQKFAIGYDNTIDIKSSGKNIKVNIALQFNDEILSKDNDVRFYIEGDEKAFDYQNGKFLKDIYFPFKRAKFFEMQLEVCAQGYEYQEVSLTAHSSFQEKEIIKTLTLEPRAPEVMVVINGNYGGVSGAEAFSFKAGNVISALWKDYFKNDWRRQVGAIHQKEFILIESKRQLKAYCGSSESTDIYLNDELKQAKEKFNNGKDKCGKRKKVMIYISKMHSQVPNISEEILKDIRLYIIAPPPIPSEDLPKFQSKSSIQWKTAAEEAEIKGILENILEGKFNEI